MKVAEKFARFKNQVESTKQAQSNQPSSKVAQEDGIISGSEILNLQEQNKRKSRKSHYFVSTFQVVMTDL
jgi:hypothetical protein